MSAILTAVLWLLLIFVVPVLLRELWIRIRRRPETFLERYERYREGIGGGHE